MSPLRQFIVYGVGGAASRLAAILLVPLYTRTLAVDVFGQLELALAVHALVVIVAGLQVESAVARDYYAARDSTDEPALKRAALQLTLVGSAALALPLAAAAASGLFDAWLPAQALWLLAAMTLPAQLLGVQQVMLRFEGRATRYALLSFTDLVLAALFSLVLIVGLGLGLAGALAAVLLAKTLCVALAWPATFAGAWRSDAPPGGWRRRMLAYGVPALPAVLVGWLSNAGNRVLLAATLTLQDVAIAGLALKVAAIFGFVVFSLRLAWEPYSMQRLQQHASDPGFFARALQWYAVGMFPVLMLALLAAPAAVTLLAPPAYASALLPALPMIAAMYWVGMTNMSLIGIQAARRTALLLPVFGWGAAVNVGVLLALAGGLGPLSAGVGLFAGNVISALLALWLGNRVSDIRLPLRLLLVAAPVTAALPLAAGWLLAATAGRSVPPAWYGGVSAAAIMLALALLSLGIGPRRCREMAAAGARRLRPAGPQPPESPP